MLLHDVGAVQFQHVWWIYGEFRVLRLTLIQSFAIKNKIFVLPYLIIVRQ